NCLVSSCISLLVRVIRIAASARTSATSASLRYPLLFCPHQLRLPLGAPKFQLLSTFQLLTVKLHFLSYPRPGISRDVPMTDQKKTRRQMLEEFVSKKHDDAFSRYGLAMECMNSGDPSAADIHFRALLERNADYIPGYLMYGQLLARESRASEDRQILSTGIAAAAKQGNQHASSERETLQPAHTL